MKITSGQLMVPSYSLSNDLDQIETPPSGYVNLFIDSRSGTFFVKKSSGAIVPAFNDVKWQSLTLWSGNYIGINLYPDTNFVLRASFGTDQTYTVGLSNNQTDRAVDKFLIEFIQGNNVTASANANLSFPTSTFDWPDGERDFSTLAASRRAILSLIRNKDGKFDIHVVAWDISL